MKQRESRVVKSAETMIPNARYVRLHEYKRVEAQCKAMYKVLKKIAKNKDCWHASCGQEAIAVLATIDGEVDAIPK
jgi:hypothetical protein